MSCICQIAQKVPTCLEELVLGSVSEVNAEVLVLIRNKTTGYNHSQYVTTDENGEVIIDLQSPQSDFYNQNSYYEISVLTEDNSLRLPITIGELEYDCVGVYFEDIHGLDATTWTLKMNEDAEPIV
jgi:hypothetical protein